jgi:uncharacterized membrane protein AbrB (regulator of aidB expression)
MHEFDTIAGFYPTANQCVKCPDSPYALIVGFLMLVLAAAGLGFFLNKKGVNLAFVSIGVDFMQVLAMFANARIPWPDRIKELFRVLAGTTACIIIRPSKKCTVCMSSLRVQLSTLTSRWSLLNA